MKTKGGIMNNRYFVLKRFLFIMVIIPFVLLSSSHAKRGPVGLLIHANGDVYHTYRGKNQKKVYRNMFLFNGSSIKTTMNSTCRLIDQVNSLLVDLSENTEIQIIKEGIHVVKGSISKGPINGGLLNGFRRKYSRAQRYSSIQRRAIKKTDLNFFTAKFIVISKKYPDIVWENVGAEYEYQLTISGKKYNVKPSKEHIDIVRFSLTDLLPGQYSYKVDVVKNNEIVASSDPGHQIIMLSDKKQQEIENSKEYLKKYDADNFFLEAYHLDEKGLKVAALDLFQKYLATNQNNNDTRMFLIKAYNELGLKKCKAKEMVFFYQLIDD
jgi:hypothetical protein